MRYNLSNPTLLEEFFYEEYFPEPRSQRDFIRYKRFINSRQKKNKGENDNLHVHHILPVSLFPEGFTKEEIDHPYNLIPLTLREHLTAHMFLWKALGGKMTYVFNMLTNYHRMKFNFRLFEKLKLEASEQHKEFLKEYYSKEENRLQRGDFRRGKTYEEVFGEERAFEISLKISEKAKGRKRESSWNSGLTKETDERIQKMSDSLKGNTWTEQRKEKEGKQRRGRVSITDGKNVLFVKDEKDIPDGYEFGTTRELIEKRRHSQSEETKKKLKEFREGKSYEELYGEEKSIELKQNQSKRQLGKIIIFKENKEKFIQSEDLSFYEDQGWKRGRVSRISITKEGKEKRIPKNDLEEYIQQGWKRGRGDAYEGQNNPSQKRKEIMFSFLEWLVIPMLLDNHIYDKEIIEEIYSITGYTLSIDKFIDWCSHLRLKNISYFKPPKKRGKGFRKTECIFI